MTENFYIKTLIKNCDDTLCLITSKPELTKFYEISSKSNIDDCINTFQEWREEFRNTKKTYLFRIEIRIKGKYMVGSKELKGNFFTHSFNLINIPSTGNIKFRYCDSWQGIHFINCRDKLFSISKIILYIVMILETAETKQFNDLDLLDYFLNDDDGNNWSDDYEKVLQSGEVAEKYTKEFISKLPTYMYDLKPEILIEAYEK